MEFVYENGNVLIPVQGLLLYVAAPVSDVINEVLFKHEAPFLDDVEQGLSKRTRVHAEPLLKDDADLHRFHVLIDHLVRVDLQRQQMALKVARLFAVCYERRRF